jgi:anti-sigma factor RsiW
MKHFSTETLLDFARGLLPSVKADQVKHHLEGCEKCRGSYDMWRALIEAGRREKKYRPSESAVQRAKEAFGLRAVSRRPFERKTGARLIFDSFLHA